MKEISRPLYTDEIRLLNKLKTKLLKKRVSRFKLYHFIPIVLTGVILIYMASLIRVAAVTFFLGTVATGCFCFVAFAPYEMYQQRRSMQTRLALVNQLLMENELQVTVVHALKITLAKEYDDEGDLFLIEYEPGTVLYLWDHDYQLRRRFPCREFEIYKDDFAALTGRPIHALSERIIPRQIDAKAKWSYLKKYGGPGHMTTEQVDFEELMGRFVATSPTT